MMIVIDDSAAQASRASVQAAPAGSIDEHTRLVRTSCHGLRLFLGLDMLHIY